MRRIAMREAPARTGAPTPGPAGLFGTPALVGFLLALAPCVPAQAADSVVLQCGREYQAARAAGTLNGADWNAYRAACAERLRTAAAAPAAVPAGGAPAAATPAPDPGAAAAAAPTAAAAAPTDSAASGGMAAMHARQKRCGVEWRAEKAKLLAQTPGLTWPKYWSQCNTRLKAAGG